MSRECFLLHSMLVLDGDLYFLCLVLNLVVLSVRIDLQARGRAHVFVGFTGSLAGVLRIGRIYVLDRRVVTPRGKAIVASDILHALCLCLVFPRRESELGVGNGISCCFGYFASVQSCGC